jgi:Uncharacterized protein conserved in bacteria (DUF2066)
MRLFASLFVAASLLTAPAFAAGRGDVFSVSDVAVDVTSADSSRARDLGFTQAQAAAFDRLVRRLTLPADLQRVGAPGAAGTPLDQYVDGVDIQQEGRSGTRYLARMVVSFNAPAIRKLLTDKGLTVYETRTAPVLVAPVLAGGTPEQAAAWRAAWEQGGFAEELAPLAVAPATLIGAPDWAQAQPAAAAAGASTALYVVARVEGATLAVALTEVAAGAAPRDLGQFTTAWQTSSADNGAVLFKALANAANDRVQNEWKQKLAAGAGQRARVAATVAFTTQAEWLQVKSALAQASQTLVSDIQIEALAKDGAVLSFSHTGSDAQLAAELNRYGVQYAAGAGGATLRAGRL